MSLSSRKTFPKSGLKSPLIVLMRVVLPEPFGPIRILILRSSTSIEIPSNARRLPNDFTIPLIERMLATGNPKEK